MNKKKLIEDLRSIQRDAKMETAHFGKIGMRDSFVYPSKESEVTEFIVERTELWRETWIIGMLEAVIEDLECNAIRYR